MRNGFSCLDVDDTEYDENDTISAITDKRQEQLYTQMTSAKFPDALTRSGYFEDIHVESVLTKKIDGHEISLLEVVATIDKSHENPKLQDRFRYEQWEGNIISPP